MDTPNQTAATAAPPRRRRRWQWTVRGMILLTTLIAIVLALYFNHDRRPSARAVATLRKLGAHVIYDYQIQGETSFTKFARWFGEDYFGSVYSVRIDEKQLSAEQLQMLTGLPNLQVLYLQHIDCDTTDWKPLGKLHELRELHLWGDCFGNADLGVLQTLPKLQTLNLNETMITDEGVPQLTKLAQLKSISLLRTAVTKTAVNELQTLLPNCRIQDAGTLPALIAVLRFPDGQRTNRYLGKFSVICSAEGRSFSQTSTKLVPSHLWIAGLPAKNGTATLAVKLLDAKLEGSVQVNVVDGKAQPHFVEIPMQPIPQAAATP